MQCKTVCEQVVIKWSEFYSVRNQRTSIITNNFKWFQNLSRANWLDKIGAEKFCACVRITRKKANVGLSVAFLVLPYWWYCHVLLAALLGIPQIPVCLAQICFNLLICANPHNRKSWDLSGWD